jgi:hypothetical protein
VPLGLDSGSVALPRERARRREVTHTAGRPLDRAVTCGYTRRMDASLAGLDIPVLLPAGTAPGELTVVATGRSSAGSAPAYWESLAVAPDDGTGGASWTLETHARRGCRPGADGGWTVDLGLPAVAQAAVGGLLLRQIPHGLSVAELERRADEATGTARMVGARVDDPGIWARTTVDVDGHGFVLWVHRRAEGFAAVADLGPCFLVMHGATEPAAWAFTLASPDDARAALEAR